MAILREIVQARTERLIEKRERAIQNKDYRKVWILNTKINKSVNTMISLSC